MSARGTFLSLEECLHLPEEHVFVLVQGGVGGRRRTGEEKVNTGEELGPHRRGIGSALARNMVRTGEELDPHWRGIRSALARNRVRIGEELGSDWWGSHCERFFYHVTPPVTLMEW